ncbi:MAG: ARMT1-like domain-containing protein [Candidatus Korarchaeota archaeon]
MLKIGLGCIPCSIRQTIDESLIATNDDKLRERIIRKSLEYLSSMDWNTTPLLLSINLQRIIWEETGNYDPFRELKRKCTENALSYLPQIRMLIEREKEIRDRIRIALKASLAGNIIDFGANPNFDLGETLNRVLGMSLPSSADIFIDNLLNSKSIAFLGDNAGEIVFDRLLLEEIKNYGDADITFYVKGSPMLNDAMKEDAVRSGIEKFAKIKEVPLDGNDNEIIESLEKVASECMKHEIQISKGQANFEVFHEKPFWFVLLVKCPEIMRKTKKEYGTPIVSKGPFTL